MDPLDPRERDLLGKLERELRALDHETLSALGRALERGEVELEAGEWGSRDDGSGCLLSLAAWELGLEGGDALLVRSIAAVRIPALFDELWALLVARTGDVTIARRLAEELVQGAVGARQTLEPVGV